MNKKYFVNEEAFSNVNIESCYWAGFLAADGSVAKNGNTVSLALSVKDKEQIERYAKFVHFSSTPKKYKNKSYSVRFASKHIKEQLKQNWNIVPQKTFTLQPPNLRQDELVDAFIVGYIDGDGCINLSKERKNIQLSIVGTKPFLEWIKARFESILQEEAGHIAATKKVFTLVLSKRKAFEILTYLNKVPVSKMERKWNKLQIARSEYGVYKPWTKEDENILRKLHPKTSIRKIWEKHFSERPYASVEKRCSYLGLKKHYETKWEHNEDLLLDELYGKMSVREIQEKHFPYRTYSSVKNRMVKVRERKNAS